MTPEQKAHAMATFSVLLDEPEDVRVFMRVVLFAEGAGMLRAAAAAENESSVRLSSVGTLLGVLAECVTPEIPTESTPPHPNPPIPEPTPPETASRSRQKT
jgi:hypothetical protein